MNFNVDIMLGLIVIVLEKTMMFWGFGLICWLTFKITKLDGFTLIPSYVFSIIVIFLGFKTEKNSLIIIVVVLSGIIGYILAKATTFYVVKQKSSSNKILSILLATIAIIILDLVTFDQGINPSPVVRSLKPFALLSIFIAVIYTHFWARTRAGKKIMLGKSFEWALKLWFGSPLRESLTTVIYQIFCWYGIILLPIMTTGVQTIDILKNFSYGILIAQISLTRSPYFMLIITFVFACLLVTIDFFSTVSIFNFLVELAIFMVLIVWYKYKTHRAIWGDA